MQMEQKKKSVQKDTAKETLRGNIKNYIQKQIAEGRYQPGDRIVETQLAKELNVSQAPVREAILELSSIGMLEGKPYSGTFVRYLTIDDIEDIFHTRAFVEEYAARRAAKRATQQQLDEMESLILEMEHNGDFDKFVYLDEEFHALVMDAAQSPALKHIWSMLRMAEWTYLCASITKFSLKDLVDQHRMIYTYLSKRDDHSAGAYMFLHIKGFGDEMCQYYQELQKKKRQK
jgi:Transcriptional regulators